MSRFVLCSVAAVSASCPFPAYGFRVSALPYLSAILCPLSSVRMVGPGIPAFCPVVSLAPCSPLFRSPCRRGGAVSCRNGMTSCRDEAVACRSGGCPAGERSGILSGGAVSCRNGMASCRGEAVACRAVSETTVRDGAFAGDGMPALSAPPGADGDIRGHRFCFPQGSPVRRRDRVPGRTDLRAETGPASGAVVPEVFLSFRTRRKKGRATFRPPFFVCGFRNLIRLR